MEDRFSKFRGHPRFVIKSRYKLSPLPPIKPPVVKHLPKKEWQAKYPVLKGIPIKGHNYNTALQPKGTYGNFREFPENQPPVVRNRRKLQHRLKPVDQPILLTPPLKLPAIKRHRKIVQPARYRLKGYDRKQSRYKHVSSPDIILSFPQKDTPTRPPALERPYTQHSSSDSLQFPAVVAPGPSHIKYIPSRQSRYTPTSSADSIPFSGIFPYVPSPFKDIRSKSPAIQSRYSQSSSSDSLPIIGNDSIKGIPSGSPSIQSPDSQYTYDIFPAVVVPDPPKLKKNPSRSHVTLPKLPVLLRTKRFHRSGNDIERDSSRLKKLMKAVRNNTWEDVWNILGSRRKPKHDYLINVIPEGETLSLLHRAVLSRNTNAVWRLLQYKACDEKIQTKRRGKLNALELADRHGYSECKDLLGNSHSQVEAQQIETFRHSGLSSRAFSLFHLTLASFKSTFHPGNIHYKRDIFHLLESIFQDIQSSDRRFEQVKNIVNESISRVSGGFYKQVVPSRTRDEFYGAVIRLLTVENEIKLYKTLNSTMRRQKEYNYRPTAMDLELGPFALVCQMILLYWKKLQKESGFTFRRMRATDEDIAQYQVGVEFTWMSVVPSSKDKGKASKFPMVNTKVQPGKRVISFKINNQEPSDWKPRNIEKYAKYKESERLYPAGAQFRVTDLNVTPNCTYIDLKLLSF